MAAKELEEPNQWQEESATLLINNENPAINSAIDPDQGKIIWPCLAIHTNNLTSLKEYKS